MTSASQHPWHGTAPAGRQPVVVGVVPRQHAQYVRRAATLAREMGTGLVCVWVDGSRIVVAEDAEGDLLTMPLDPDQDDEPEGRASAEDLLEQHLEDVLTGTDVPWRFVYTVGEAATGLGEVATSYDAALIAVGPRRAGLTGWMNELVGGSVAGRLAHTQHRPVTIFPPAPRGVG